MIACRYVVTMASAMTGIERLTSVKGSTPERPETAIVTPATGLEERAMPLTSCSG